MYRTIVGTVAILLVVSNAQAARGGQDSAHSQGMKVYQAQKCALCHSIDGKGNKKGPLDEVGSKLTAAEIRQWLVAPKEMTEKMKSTRKPVMKSYASLSKEDLDALVKYMESLTKK